MKKKFLPFVILIVGTLCVSTAVDAQTVTIKYDSPGTYSVTIPACGITSVQAELWGAGGGGGGARVCGPGTGCCLLYRAAAGASAGGGGGYSTQDFGNSTGSFSIIVGKGGQGTGSGGGSGTDGIECNPTTVTGAFQYKECKTAEAGGSSQIVHSSATVTAGGGGGGNSAAADTNNGSVSYASTSGGAGGTGNSGTGGVGGQGSASASGTSGSGSRPSAGGAAGGTGFGANPNNGGAATSISGGSNSGDVRSASQGNNGGFPGGGGGGACAIAQRYGTPDCIGGNGGNGADGRVIITLNFSLPVISGATNICDCSSTMTLNVANPCSPASYIWKRNGTIVGNGTTLTVAPQAGIYTVEATISGYEGGTPIISGSGIAYTNNNFILTSAGYNVTTYPAPQTTVWQGGGVASNWNDPANWSNGVPCPCTNVSIPAGISNYPVLQPASTTYSQPVCDAITFQFGAEVAKTNYLQYNTAKVDLTLQSNRWYMLAPVLQQQYSGDFLADEAMYRKNPSYYMMYYQTTNPQTGVGKATATWSAPFNTLDQLLPLCSGQAVWVDNGNQPNTNFTVHFPKDSTRYAYYNQLNKLTRYSETMARGKQYRFIYEGNAAYQSNGNGTFTQNFNNSDGYSQLVVGNPYMSHLDIVAFQSANSAYFAPSFRIWKEGGSFESYLITGSNVVSTDGGVAEFKLPPMQSVIMNVANPAVSTLPIQFTPDMSVTAPGQSLRAPGVQQNANDVVKIEILSSDLRQSGLAIRYKEGVSRHYDNKKDVWTLFPASVSDYVLLYALVDGGAASIYTVGDIENPIDLDISTGNSVKSQILSGSPKTYTIRIADNNTDFNGADVYLYDIKKNTTHNLSVSEYDFECTKEDITSSGNLTGRFQLFAKANSDVITKTDNASANNGIVITKNNQTISVASTKEDPVKNITVFNLMGQKLYEKTNLNTTHWSFHYPQNNQVVTINVQTEKAYKTEKLLENK
ncbi:MAG: hypothetical protein LBN27_12405 [Prevotellaceae bacterium]|jgi:hypothetical protein|nr:hypothetical protein [Prevotellaceae bacterium]